MRRPKIRRTLWFSMSIQIGLCCNGNTSNASRLYCEQTSATAQRLQTSKYLNTSRRTSSFKSPIVVVDLMQRSFGELDIFSDKNLIYFSTTTKKKQKKLIVGNVCKRITDSNEIKMQNYKG